MHSHRSSSGRSPCKPTLYPLLSLPSSLHYYLVSISNIMHHAPPPSSSGDLPLVQAPENNTSINWVPASLGNQPVSRKEEYSKEAGGIWGEGCSAATSLADNQDEITLRASLARHFRTNIDTTHTDIVLIICGFVSGLVDGLSFNAWGSFASMQTGMLPPHPLSSAQTTANQATRRKQRLHSPRCLRPARLPSLPLG